MKNPTANINQIRFDKEKSLRLLEKLGIKDGIIAGDELRAKCPLHKERRNSFSINLTTCGWICFSACGSGYLPQLVARIKEISDEEAELWILAEGNFDLSEFDELEELFKEKEEEKVNFNLPIVKFPFPIGQYPNSILERGFTKETAEKWEFAYNKTSNSLVLPVRDYRKEIVGWVIRHPNGIEPRYYNYPEMERSKLLYGEYLLNDKENVVCITEGPLNTVWLDQNGFQSVATFGAEVSDNQITRLINLKKGEYILCLDNDLAGEKAINGYWIKNRKYKKEGLLDKLKKYAFVSYIQLPKDKKDVQDVRNSNELKEIIKNREIF